MNFGKQLITELLTEASIKKVVAIYPGRFQPLSLHHAKTFKWIQSKFGANNSYIVTSDKVEIPKSPFNFNEKKKIINKYGFSNVVNVRNPYVATEALNKFNSDTTTAVFVVGSKDASRLSNSKFYREWKGTAEIPYREGAYYLIAPHISLKVPGYGEMDGTTVRRALGDKSNPDKKDLFKSIFGFYDNSTYKLVTSKLEALNEIMTKFSEKLVESSNITGLGKAPIDDGPRFYYGNQKTYRTKTKEMALRLGFDVVNYLIGKDEFEVYDTDFPDGPPQSVTYFPVGLAGVYGVGTNYSKDLKGKPAFYKWSRNILRIVQSTGYEFITYLGAEKSIKSSQDEPTKEAKTNIIKENLIQHANHELKLAGLFDKDADYNGMIAKATMELIEKFSEQGHSGFSALWVRDVFHRLSNFETLTPITSDPNEWTDVSKSCGGDEMWQNKRNPAVFSKDGGKTWYNVDDKIIKEALQNVLKKLVEKYNIPPDVINSFSMQETLNPKLWDNHKLKPEIRKKLLNIANNFFKELKVDVKIRDIVLTGSVANYNWSKYSDVDLHIRIKFSDVDENEDLVENYVLSKKTVWNEEHNIEISGFPVEIYVENVGETHIASGLYSVLNDKWIVEPKQKKLQIDIDDIRSKLEGYLSYTPILEKYMKNKEYNRVISTVDIIRKKIKRMRQSGLETGGEYSVENLAFKALRRSSFIGTILDMKTKAYDKEMSVGECLIMEGGMAGHMSHIFEDNNLTFGDFKQMITNSLSGTLDISSISEKTDGVNLFITYKNGKLYAARNKSQIKNPATINQIAQQFAGRGDIKDAFVFAMEDLSKAIGSLSEKQTNKIFDNGKNFMNLEVIYSKAKNVIDYDKTVIQFHGALIYDDNGNPMGEVPDSARMLAGMIKQVNADVQKHFNIIPPQVLKLKKSMNFGEKSAYFLSKLNRLQNEFNLKDSDTLGMYHQAWWQDFISKKANSMKYPMPNKVLMNLVKRWAFFDKSYRIADIKKDIDNDAFLSWVLDFDKKDHSNQVKKNIEPFEYLFLELGVEVLKNIEGFLTANPDKTVQDIRNQVAKEIRNIKLNGNVDQIKKLETQLNRIQAIGGFSGIVPSEGIVLKWRGKLLKITGLFAPLNSLLGIIRYAN